MEKFASISLSNCSTGMCLFCMVYRSYLSRRRPLIGVGRTRVKRGKSEMSEVDGCPGSKGEQ